MLVGVPPHPLRLAKYSKETSYLGTLQSIDSKRFSLKVLIQSDLQTARMRKPRRFAGVFSFVSALTIAGWGYPLRQVYLLCYVRDERKSGLTRFCRHVRRVSNLRLTHDQKHAWMGHPGGVLPDGPAARGAVIP